MPRKVSFFVLLAILSAIAVLFFKVMANFILPIFLALMLAVMFGPLHWRLVSLCKGHNRIAAGLTTIVILLICLVPLSLVLTQAAREGVAYSKGADVGMADDQVVKLVNTLNEKFRLQLRVDQIRDGIHAQVQEWLVPLVQGTTQYVTGTFIGLIIMIVSLYYFLADGPGMIQAIMKLSPLEERYEQQLVGEFETVVRAVVAATLLGSVIQGLLAGLAFYLVGMQSVFLLIILAMFLSMIPFFGPALVWIPACLWLWLHQGRLLPALLVGIYGIVVICLVDYVIRPWVLHGRSNLHPLLALLSVIGGLQALGPIGIFVGPMVVVFLYSLLNMVQAEIGAIDREANAAGSEVKKRSKGPSRGG